MSQESAGIYKEYFTYTKTYQEKYGPRTIVLLQVGAFFEVYGLKHPISGDISESNIDCLSEICQLNISDKKITYGKDNLNIVMAGFRDFTIDKYISRLTEAGYTVPVFVQEKNGKTVTRTLSKVYSAGTYLACDADSSPKMSNNIMCIWLETHSPLHTKTTTTPTITKDTIVIGVSIVNIFTGKSYMFQYETAFYMSTTTFDELERCIAVYAPCEVLVVSPFSENMLNTILQYAGLRTLSIHRFLSTDEKPTKCVSQKYIKQILSVYFGEETYDVCCEFQSNIVATQAFCYLLDFIKEQNPDLVRKIAIPELKNQSTKMVLANHTLSQLNILNSSSGDGHGHGKLSSVLSFLNKCSSPMGRRLFQYQLTNPTFDEDWLNEEYRMTTELLQQSENIPLFRKKIALIRDMEKLCRQLVIRKIYPASVHHLYNSVTVIQDVLNRMGEHHCEPRVTMAANLFDYLCKDFVQTQTNPGSQYVYSMCDNIKHFLDAHFVIEQCKETTSMTNFEENIIQKGISTRLDDAVTKYDVSKKSFQSIKEYFNEIIQKAEKTTAAQSIDYVKIHETEKSGSCLQITSRRSHLLKNSLDTKAKSTDTIIIQVTEQDSIRFLIKDITFSKASATNVTIEFPLLNDICRNLLLSKDNIQEIVAEEYLNVLKKFENLHLTDIENLAVFVGKLDVLNNKAYIAKEYNYCCPTIDNTNDKSFVDVTELRHCLIEHIQQNELYVTNDMVLGKTSTAIVKRKSPDGILLYGTNAVGKTSFIRALGIAVIMAQSGLYVPCSRFVYKPYTAIFSRILGNDNIFKGLSTFAVEMSELRVILKMADNNSLILGDELCSGTETESALSIFVAGLCKLHEKQSSFLFATHFHEIVDYDEIKSLSNMELKHMAVSYNRELDCLVYDRKLRDGSGPRIYGLEVCKSLYLDEDFLQAAYAIRNKYYPNTSGELSHGTSTYNSKKIRGMCEKCNKELAEEVHHLQQQKEANEDGFIGTFHKNHPANLMAVCETCHDEFHTNTKRITGPIVRKKTTKGYAIV